MKCCLNPIHKTQSTLISNLVHQYSYIHGLHIGHSSSLPLSSLPFELQSVMAKVLDSHFLAITAIVTVLFYSFISLFFLWFVILFLTKLSPFNSGFPLFLFFYFFSFQVCYQFIFFVITALLKFDKVTDFAGIPFLA